MTQIKVSEEIAAAIFKEIDYSQNQLEQDFIALKDWFQKQEHLPASRLKESDVFLKNYLIGCKGSLETSKRKLDHYYSMRGASPLFDERDPLNQNVKNTVKNFFIATLPKAAPDGGRISVLKISNPDVAVYDFLGSMQRILAISELRVRQDNISSGEYYVLDGENFTASHILRVNPGLTRDTLMYIQEAMPARIKRMIFINCPPPLELAVNKLIRPFLKKKLSNRIVVSQEGASALQQNFPKEILPKDYGGDAPSLEDLSNEWMSMIIEKRDWFIKDLTDATDEKLRPADCPIPSNPYFGLQGSIKSLSID